VKSVEPEEIVAVVMVPGRRDRGARPATVRLRHSNYQPLVTRRYPPLYEFDGVRVHDDYGEGVEVYGDER